MHISKGGDSPESGDHFGESDDFLDAVADEVGEVREHGQTRVVLLAGVWTAAAVLIHHQQITEVQLSVHRLYRDSGETLRHTPAQTGPSPQSRDPSDVCTTTNEPFALS